MIRFLILFLGILVLSGAAVAQSKSGVQAYAVQEHPDQKKDEISLYLSYLLEDHFTNYTGFGISYIHSITPYFGWEVIQASSLSPSPTGLEKSLNEKYGAVVPDPTDIVKYWVTSNLVYTPLYMKNLYMGKRVIWSDLSLVGGYGIVRLETHGNTNLVDIGAILRFFQNDRWAYKLDLRQYLFFSSAVKPNFGVTLGISYNFGSLVTENKTTTEEKAP